MERTAKSVLLKGDKTAMPTPARGSVEKCF